MQTADKKAETSMEYYEVSPVSQRITWLNGQHMKLTAGLTALSWALGCLYDSRHPQVVWQPGCGVKLDRPKVNRIKGHTSHIHPVSCPVAVTTAVQTGTYLTFYLENFNTVDQCVLELEGLWRVHKENEDDIDHRNKIWVVRVDTAATHDLDFHQPKTQDIFEDLSLLAPDFFTTRRSSKAQRASPTKRSRAGQHKKPASYKINSARRRSHKRSLTPVTAGRIMQQAFTQCQHNLHGAEAAGGRGGHSSSIEKETEARANQSFHSSVTEGEESWSNVDGRNWSNGGRTNWMEHEGEMNEAADENWSEDENGSEFDGDNWNEIKNKNHKAENGFRNYEDENYIQKLKLADEMNGIEGFTSAGTENDTFIGEDRDHVEVVNINQGHVNQQLEDCNDETINHTIKKKDNTDHNLKQRLGRISVSPSVLQAFPTKELAQSEQTSRDGTNYQGANVVRSIADSIRKVQESLVTHQQFQTSPSQSSNMYNPIYSGPSPAPGNPNEKETEAKDTATAKADQTAEPKFMEVEEHHKRMLVDLSKHEVVGTWLYSSDEEDDDDYDDDEGIYKKEEAFFRVDVTELMHELARVERRGHSPNLTIPSTSASKGRRSASKGSSLEELQAPFTSGQQECGGPTEAEQKLEAGKCDQFEGEILREVQPKVVNILDERMHSGATGHEPGKERTKDRGSHNVESKSWSAMAKDVLLRSTRTASKSEKSEIAWPLPNRNSKNTGKLPEHQSNHKMFIQTRIQRPEAEENKENSMSAAHHDNENTINFRNKVKQFEALNSNTEKSEKKIPDKSPRGSLSRQRTENAKKETRQEARAQLDRSATNLEIGSKKAHLHSSPRESINKHESLQVSSTQVSPTGISTYDEKEKFCQQSSLDSEFRPSTSNRIPTTKRIGVNNLPSATETKANDEQNDTQATEHRNSTRFSLLRSDSLLRSKNKATTKTEQLFNSGNKYSIPFSSAKSSISSRVTATKFRANSSTEFAPEMPDDITRKGRSESLSLFPTKHDPTQRSASVMPYWQSQSLSSLLEPDHEETDPQKHNSESSVSLEETLEHLDRSGRRSPKLKQNSIFMLKKQFSKSRELRILPGYQQNSRRMANGSEPIPSTALQTEQVNGGADVLQGNPCSQIAPTPDIEMHRLQHRDEPNFRFRNKEATNLERRSGDLSRLDRNNEEVLHPKPCTQQHQQEYQELQEQISGAVKLASEAAEKSVPESALVVFRLQPSAPHQAWQFKKAILKVHHRDNTKKKEDKTTLKRNAHLHRKRR